MISFHAAKFRFSQRDPKDAWMLDMLLDWAPDEAARKKILVANPARLYAK